MYDQVKCCMTTFRARFVKNSVIIKAIVVQTSLIDTIIVTLQRFRKTRPWIVHIVKQSHRVNIKKTCETFVFFAVHVEYYLSSFLCITLLFLFPFIFVQ